MTPFGWMQTLRDRADELAARRLRHTLGRRRWIVSWSPERGCDANWRARISCPEIELTIERASTSRCRAIVKAREALRWIAESPSPTMRRRDCR